MLSAAPAADGYALALEEARRALDAQERVVAQLSIRAGLLISAAAIVTSFLGGPVLARSDIDLAAWLATAAFIAVTWPSSRSSGLGGRWSSRCTPSRSSSGSSKPPTRRIPKAFGERWRFHMGRSIDRNAREISAMMTSFHIASVLLAMEIGAWVMSLVIVG